jgi:putative ABC transport system permease protein
MINCTYIVGSCKGSQYQLVLNTIFHVEKPLDNVPIKFMEDLKDRYSSVIDATVPMCMGHDYKTYPAIATTQDYFDKLTYKDGVEFEFEQGRNFKDENFYEAVIGSKAAFWLNLNIGDEVKPIASSEAKEKNAEHAHRDFKIVGILKPTGTANDRAIFMNIEGFWRCPAHGAQPDHAAAIEPEKKTDAETAEKHEPEHAEGNTPPEHADEAHENEKAHADHDAHAGHDHAHDVRRDISALIVRTKIENSDPRTIQLASKITAQMANDVNAGRIGKHGNLAQAVSPAAVLTQLLETMVGKIQMILLILAVLVVIEAGIGIMVSMYNSMSDRKHDIAIMRALGASRLTVMSIILLESILLALGGGLFGLVVGHGLVAAISTTVAESSGVFISGLDFRPVELVLIPALVVLATLVGYLPAMYAYKTDVAKSLMAGT